MAAGIAGAPQADPIGVDLGPALQVGDGAAPVRDLPPGVDVLPGKAVAGAEVAVVVQQDGEARLGEGPREGLQAVVPDPA